MHRRKCTTFLFHPWGPKEQKRPGIVLWVPQTMKELIQAAVEQLIVPADSCILSKDGGKILDIELIDNGQKLYLVSKTHKL